MDNFVSVIIPNYNHSIYLKKRIETVLQQSYQHFEVILLDDASTDDSLAIINQYKQHPKISHIILNKKNSGSPFVQWKKGIDLAKGTYIWIAESDDYSDLNFLEKAMNLFANHKKLSLVFCNSIIEDLIKNTSKKLISNKKSGLYSNNNSLFLYDWFFNNNEFRIVNASSCVFKTDCINQKILEKITNHRYSGDKLFWASMLIDYPDFGYLEEVLNFHTFHAQTTRNSTGIIIDNIRNNELLEIYNYCNFTQNIDSNVKRKNEIGIRFIRFSLYQFLIYKKIKISPFLKGMKLITWDKKRFGKIYRTLKQQ